MTDRSEPICGLTSQASRTSGAVEVYVCWREPSHIGGHHGPLMGRSPGPGEAFMTWEARQPDSEALRLLRARIDAEPFFPKGDGPSIGNAAAFRDYKRRILAALPPNDPPALAQPSASIDVELLAEALFYSIGPGNLNGYPYDDEYRAIFRENADDTLAEYARLAAQPEAQPAEDADAVER